MKFTKPLFFKNITLGNGYTLNPNQHYRMFETSMDYVQKELSRFRAEKIKVKNLPFCEIIKPIDIDWSKAPQQRYCRVYKIINDIKSMREQMQRVYIDYQSKSKEEKAIIVAEANAIRQKQVEAIQNKTFTDIELYMLLREIDKDKNAGYARTIFDTLFSTGNKDLYDMIRESSGDIYKLSKRQGEIAVKLFDYPYFKQKIG